MYKRLIKYITFVFLLIPGIVFGDAPESDVLKHEMVAMRMIGHEILRSVGDSTSRVLPIQMNGGRYQIQFESPFDFSPDDLTLHIDSVIAEYKIASHYIIEVEDCTSHQVVYAYEYGIRKDSYVIPCRGREYPVGCYEIFFTKLNSLVDLDRNDTVFSPAQFISAIPDVEEKEEGKSKLALWILPLILVMGWLMIRRNRVNKTMPASMLVLGKYHFDTKNMVLQFDGESEVLTGKETDLLTLLYNSVNETLEREKILQSVWGDEGDYVGRTLDVFISKLRKKLDRDPNIKIINIRGIGYKLVLNDA